MLLTILSSAQVMNGTAPFSAATPFLEPDGRIEKVKVSKDEYVLISKVKGGLNGESDYSLERYNTALTCAYKIPVKIAANEDIYELSFNGKDLILFTIIHDLDAAQSKLMAYGYNPSTGAKMYDKILMENKVQAYQNVRTKGGIEETFENAIASGLSKNFIIPFQYQYQISYSPDGSKLLAFIFDYNKPTMIANAVVFDKDLNKLNAGIIPIDNNFINYGVYVNNKGDIYILNVDKLGRIVVIQYNMETRDNKLLDIQYSSTQREGLKFQFLNDNEVFVGSVNTNNGKMQGVMYAKFNFEKNLVEKINFHDFSDGLLQTADAVRSGKFKTPENWQNYEITHFIVNKYEKVLMVLEKREINAIEYQYKSENVLDAEHWKERMGKVNTESMVLVSFNSEDELMWENYYAKSQSSDITSGMISSSFLANIDDEVIRMVYATSDNAAGTFNIYNFVEFNAQNGNKVKDMSLQNDESLALVRNYSMWMDDKLVLIGRKGLLGKKYVLNTYSFSPGN